MRRPGTVTASGRAVSATGASSGMTVMAGFFLGSVAGIFSTPLVVNICINFF